MKVSPRHDKFINTLANSSIHIIATMRGKDQYEIEKDDRGKTSVKKLGVGAKQRDGFEYEFTVTFSLDTATHMATIQKDMLVKSTKMRDSKIKEAGSTKEIVDGVEGQNFVKANWCGCRECEDKIKAETAATSRVIVGDAEEGEVCAVCGKKATKKVLFARAY